MRFSLSRGWLGTSTSPVRRVTAVQRRRLARLEQLEDRLQPATFVVSNLSDAGLGSFRAAIDKANVAYGADVIDLSGLSGTISLLSMLPTVTDTTAINGPGASKLTVQLDASAPASRIVNLGGTISVSGLTLTGGRPTDNGGALFVFGHTSISNCVITGNTAGGGGGAIFVFDTSLVEIDNTYSPAPAFQHRRLAVCCSP